MGELFNGWRRKIGVVTLVVAWVLTSAWVRSLCQENHCVLVSRPERHVQLTSFRGGLEWSMADGTARGEWNKGLRIVPKIFTRIVQQNRVDGDRRYIAYEFGPTEYVGDLLNETFEGFTLIVWRLPYWSFVLPLTLLSAWLLFAKPQPAEKPEPSLSPEPVDA